MTLSTESTPLTPIQKRLQMARQRQAAEQIQISKRPNSPAAPLSFAQERQWLVEQLSPGDPANNRPTALRLHGNLDEAALQHSLAWLARRHEPLRTSFPAPDGEVMACISEETAVSLSIHDLQSVPAAERESVAQQQLTAAARRPFDLQNSLPMRTDLWRLSSTEHLLLVNVHHISFDGWSEGILRDELAACYQAFSRRHQPTLPPLPIAYSDFAHWQRQQAANDVWAADLAYWRQQLSGDIPALNLPTDRVATAVSGSGAEQTIHLPLDLVEQLQSLGQQNEATLFMTLLAAYKLLLHRLTQTTDITVGVPVAGRDRLELEKLIGLFVNMVVLRSDLSNERTFAALLQDVRQTTLDGLSHQALPFAQLIEALQPERNLEQPPFYQTVFQLRNYRASQTASKSDTLQFEPYAFAMNTAPVDLSLDAALKQDGLQIRARYRADRFTSQRIAILLAQYRGLLSQLAAEPNRPLHAYSLVTETQTLPDLTQPIPEIAFTPVTETIAAQAQRQPQQTAVVQGDLSWSYAELTDCADDVAAALLHEDLQPGDVVAVYGRSSFGLVASLLGILRSGGVFLLLDPDQPPARWQQMAEQASMQRLLTVGPPPEDLAALQKFVSQPSLEVNATNGRLPHTKTAARPPHWPVRQGQDPAYIFFTSGTTGTPKGILGSHQGLAHFLQWQQQTFAVQPSDRVAQTTGLGFDPILRDIFLPLVSGATILLPPNGMLALDDALLWLQSAEATLLHTVPTRAHAWLAEAPGECTLSALRATFFSGEPLNEALVQQWRTLAPQAEIYNFYGPTETTMIKAWHRVPPQPEPGIQPLGRPLPQTELLLLGPNGGFCGLGEPGEIVIRTPYRSLGYLDSSQNRPFVVNPQRSDPQDWLYHTGDKGRWRLDGLLEILGRIDDQVKIRGVRVEPAEVTAVLTAHPHVVAAYVTAHLPEGGEAVLVAYVVAATDHALQSAEIRHYLQQHLPAAYIPTHILFLPQLPLTPNGKIDRHQLPSPSSEQPEIYAYAPPQTPVQQELAALWTELLPVPRVGLNHNFFELGGHSLLATRLLARIRRHFQVELSLTTLFQAPTLAALADAVAKALPAEYEPAPQIETITALAPDADKPLSPVQERLWFLEQLEPGKSTLQLPLVVRLQGQLNVTALQQALEAVVARHAPLRTTFTLVDGQPSQEIAPTMAAPLPIVSLEEVPESERETAVTRHIQQFIKEPFDLARGPLFRAMLLKLGQNEMIFVLIMHHIISDGWSIRLLSHELSELYNAFVAERPSPLPPLPIQYSDFAAWQRQRLESDRLKKQLAYWQKQLEGAPPILELPTDFNRPPVQTGRGVTRFTTLPAALVQKLRRLGQEMDATLYMVTLAAFKLLLYRQTAQDDLVVGTPIAGRTHTETEALIGFFINTLALRTQLSAAQSFGDLVRAVREVTLEAYANQELPFERLLEGLQLERDLSRTPLFQVFFNMLNMEAHALDLNGLQSERLPWYSQDAKFDLTVYLTEQDRGDMQLRLVFNADLFSDERMQIFLEQYCLLLEQVAANARLPLKAYSLLTPETKPRLPDPRQTLADTWMGAIHERVTQQTAVAPHNIALVDAQETWRYDELEARSNQLAHHLLAQGIGAEDVVAIHAHRSATLVWAILGVFKAGAAYTILDPAYPPERLLSYLHTARPKGLIQLAAAGGVPAEVDEFFSESACRVTLPLLETAVATNFFAQYPTTPPEVQTGPDSLALVTFTSGSTGQPKGVMGRHGPLSHFLPWQTARFKLTEADRFSMLSGLSHDPLQRDIFTALWVGGTLCIPSPDLIGTPGRLAAWMAEQAITFAHMTPPMAQLLTETAVNNIPSLRYTFFVGDKLTQEDVRRLRRIAPQVTAINSYGSTETQRAVTCQLISPNTEEARHKAVFPLGRGMEDVQLLVLNEQQALAGIGEVGEIYMRSPHLARGYLGDEELTQARFLPNPFTSAPGDRLYRTGDLGRYLPDGRAVFAGRADRQVKIRGFRIEPGEIEAALLAHTAVRDAVVMVKEAPQIGPALAAYLVAPQDPSVTELRAFLQERLPDFMIPAAFVFVPAIPLTPNGKINYKALPAPDWQTTSDAQSFVAPRDEIEQQLATIWEEQLGVKPISVIDNFFALGGHSLLAVRLFARIEKRTGWHLPIALLFQHPTIAQLADVIRQREPTQALTALAPIKPYGSRPPFFCVHGGAGHVFNYQKLAGYLADDQPFYGIQPPDWTAHRVEVPDVTQLATRYLAEVRRFQPSGPYYLGGFCFGGTIVFEMARQLQAAGEEVALLALIEPASANGRAALWRSATNGKEHQRQPGLATRPEKPASARGQVKRFAYGMLYRTHRRLVRMVRSLKRGAFTLYLMTGAAVPQQYRDFYLINFVTRPARRTYTPAAPFNGNLHLTVIERIVGADPTLGWGNYATGEVELCRVKTDHLGVLREPHVQIVAKELQHWLDKAQNR